MYTNLFYGIIKDNNTEKLATLIEQELIPSFQKQHGWKGWRLVINQDSKKLALLTYWHTKEDAIKVAKSGVIQGQLNKLFPLLAKTFNPNIFVPN